VHYIISFIPPTPNLSLPRLRARARRQDYGIARDHYASAFSSADARLRGPRAVLEEVVRLCEERALR